MARPRRALTETERTRQCVLCGARPGERCTNPDGSFYATGVHASREGRPPRPAAAPRDPDETYTVIVCRNCRHPGGQHLLGDGCRLCRACPGWVQNGNLNWSDRMTKALLAAALE